MVEELTGYEHPSMDLRPCSKRKKEKEKVSAMIRGGVPVPLGNTSSDGVLIRKQGNK